MRVARIIVALVVTVSVGCSTSSNQARDQVQVHRLWMDRCGIPGTALYAGGDARIVIDFFIGHSAYMPDYIDATFLRIKVSLRTAKDGHERLDLVVHDGPDVGLRTCIALRLIDAIGNASFTLVE